MTDRWAHLGHRLGECWRDDSRNITYIHIPKNASSFVKGCLIGCGGFWKHSQELVNGQENLIVLRDPIERWCSGMAQYQFNCGHLNMPIDEVFAKITFDDHTDLQTYFLKDVDLIHTTYMRADHTLRDTITKWCLERGYQTNIGIVRDYNASLGDDREVLKDRYMKTLAERPDLVLKLKEHFALDYRLIENVQFYD